MKRTYRYWSWAEKRAAVAQMEVRRHGEVAAELGIPKRLLYSWRAHERKLEREARAEGRRERVLERENRELKGALATKVLEADFFKGVLRRIEARRQPSSGCGETASTRRSK